MGLVVNHQTLSAKDKLSINQSSHNYLIMKEITAKFPSRIVIEGTAREHEVNPHLALSATFRMVSGLHL